MTRALVRPVTRTLPLGALAAGGALGLLLAGLPRTLPGRPDPWLCLMLLRAAALAFALGLAFLLDDPARHTTAAVPAGRPLRTGLRVALVAPFAALWWAAALALVPEAGRPPVGALTLEAAAAAVLALAVAAAGVRFSDRAEPGTGAAVTFLIAAVAAPLLIPDGWTPFVGVDDDRWAAAHHQWALLLAAGAAACAAWTREPPRRRPASGRRAPVPAG
ncbi:ABC transporter [Streptomyces sp. NPDC054842]